MYADRSVLAYHYYQPPQDGTRAQIELQLAGAWRLGVGIYLTETCGGADGGVDLYDAADVHLQSWNCYSRVYKGSDWTSNGE